MKVEQTQIEQIRIAFQNMQSREDFLRLLNEAKPMVYGEKAIPFQLKQLTWYSNPKLAKNRYTEFKIKKKSGAIRTIHAPLRGLKAIQKTLSFILQCVYEPHHAATGFVRDKSIVDNAKIHVGNKYVYNIDLKDFFPSIDQARVWKCLQLQPFNLIDSKKPLFQREVEIVPLDSFKDTHAVFFLMSSADPSIILVLIDLKDATQSHVKINMVSKINIVGNTREEKIQNIKENYIIYKTTGSKRVWYSMVHKNERHKIPKSIRLSRQNIANLISSLCCSEMEVERQNEGREWILVKRNVLPQGAPTSPVLSNVICQRIDYLLTAVAKRFGLKYSRYADDITFSSMHDVYKPGSDFMNEIHRIITEQGFHIKQSKTRLQKEGYRQEVTGLLVNENVNVQKRYIKQLRMWLYYWERYGYEKAQGFFLPQYLADKGHVVKGKPDMVNVIDGKLNYLKMVKGEDNALYFKLRERFNRLTSKYNFIEKVINVWENEGVEKAMDLYYFKNNKSVNQAIDEENIVDTFLNDSADFDEIL